MAHCLAILSQFRLQDIGSDYINTFYAEQTGLGASDLECFSTAAVGPMGDANFPRPACPFQTEAVPGTPFVNCLSLRLQVAGLHFLQLASREAQGEANFSSEK